MGTYRDSVSEEHAAIRLRVVSQKTSTACHKGPDFRGLFHVLNSSAIALPKNGCLRIPLVVWYIAYKDEPQAVFVDSKQNNAPWEGKLAKSSWRLQPLLITGPTDVGLAISANFLTMIAMTAAGCVPRSRAFCVMCIATLFGEGVRATQ